MSEPIADRILPADSEQQLAELVSELTDQVCRGNPIDIEQTCQQYPELATQLRELWPAILLTDIAGAAADELPAQQLGPAETHISQANKDFSQANNDSGRWQKMTLPTRMGDYELLEEIGRGGMGVVFRARQISLEREVAVKMISRGRLASPHDWSRFLAEAAATAGIEHRCIVPVYEVGDFDGRPFFSMQLVEGQTLAERLRDGPLPEREAARMMSQIAKTIDFAHHCGLVHRDIKPSNIMVTNDGKPVITDFGLAMRLDSDANLTRSGMLAGTPAFMSPEQASSRRELLGPPTDIYSLGCVLYNMLTGSAPFIAQSPMDLVIQVIEQDPSPPRNLRPSLDRDLEMIVIRCMQKPIDLRYASAAKLAADLDAFLADEAVSARGAQFNQIIARIFRDTHHATILNNWGVLWMWHSLVLLLAGVTTWCMQFAGVTNRMIYMGVWTIGLGAWAAVFWKFRQRMGPVTFIERQIAHVWGGSMIAIAMLFPLEKLLALPALTLSPLLAVISSMVFVVKAGMLSGRFYLQAIALLICSLLMAAQPDYAQLFFGLIGASCFFFPGLRHYQRKKASRLAG
ncbi:Serine/threonine-protein kinase PknB [Stieleria bergensis]|uniref:non-specific serine/threonine protein kinase n=1 Tax=Stieleria bergensis TaxID=2528025 RepID=A0A517T183_9BACT|nr:Serine/threonine-protein kinase PknB [Planctomycetes bacterium SV_7m_r]